jgi:hypothetical protein
MNFLHRLLNPLNILLAVLGVMFISSVLAGSVGLVISAVAPF